MPSIKLEITVKDGVAPRNMKEWLLENCIPMKKEIIREAKETNYALLWGAPSFREIKNGLILQWNYKRYQKT